MSCKKVIKKLQHTLLTILSKENKLTVPHSRNKRWNYYCIRFID